MTIAQNLNAVSAWLAAGDLSRTLQTVQWIIPAVQTLHILAIAVLFSYVMLVNFRLWKLYEPASSAREVGERYLTIFWPVLAVLALSGGTLIVAEPHRSLQNSSFFLKMILLLAAIILTGILRNRLAGRGDFFDASITGQWLGRGLALGSAFVWIAIIFAGRWIAYTQV